MKRFRIFLNERDFLQSNCSTPDEQYFDLWGTFEFCLTGRTLNHESIRPNLQSDSIIESTDQAGLQYTFKGPRSLCDSFLAQVKNFPAAFAKIKGIVCDAPREVVYGNDPTKSPE